MNNSHRALAAATVLSVSAYQGFEYLKLIEQTRLQSAIRQNEASGAAEKARLVESVEVERASKDKQVADEQARFRSNMRRYAEDAGRREMEAFNGGQDLRVDIESADYDEGAKLWRLELAIAFNGNINRSNRYEMKGRLTVDKDGGNPSFARSWANTNVTDWESNRQTLTIIGAGAVLLGAAASKDEASK
jgi:hypothetical protein